MKTALKDFSEWQEASAKLTSLQVEQSTLDNQYQQGSDALRQLQALRSADKLSLEAEAYLGGGVVKQTITGKELEDLDRKRRVVRRAIEMQHDRLRVLRSELSTKICKNLRPAYQGLVFDLAQKAAALAKAVEAEIRFRDALIAGDVSFTADIPPCPFRGVGMLSDQYSKINSFLAETVREKYLSPREIEALAR